MKIHETGYWYCDNISFDFHKHDEPLSAEIVNFFREKNISTAIDFGCGYGLYATALEHHGVSCDCYDGNPNTPMLTDNKCGVIDLSAPFDLSKRYECVLSLEVGEHIPQQYEEIYLANLVRHTKKWILISWALPNQGGHGHVNEQSNEYIQQKFTELGFTRISQEEHRLRNSAHWWWFKNTIMVFLKNESV